MCLFVFFTLISYVQRENRGLEMKYIALKVCSQDDFYQYLNAGWKKALLSPPDKGKWGIFFAFRESNTIRKLGVLKRAVE